MANFRTHLYTAAATSSALAVAGYYFQFYGVTTAILCAVVGTIGGLLPDIDLEHSKPAQHGFFVASLLVSTLMTILYANRYTEDQLILDSLILWVAAFLILRYGILELFSRLTVHRGMVHSVPYMAVFALGLTCLIFYGFKLTAFVSWLFGLFLFAGALVHLVLDEIYSVNVFGLKLKKSAGTAFKFFQHSNTLGYLCLYLMVAVLMYVAPPPIDTVHALTKILKAWR